MTNISVPSTGPYGILASSKPRLKAVNMSTYKLTKNQSIINLI
jgi:hypothetical protein